MRFHWLINSAAALAFPPAPGAGLNASSETANDPGSPAFLTNKGHSSDAAK
jgi:hypothetical protein